MYAFSQIKIAYNISCDLVNMSVEYITRYKSDDLARCGGTHL